MRTLIALVAAAALFGPAAAQFRSAGSASDGGGRIGTSSGQGSVSVTDRASAQGNDQGQQGGNANGKGDPILTGFDGRTFEFFGKVGSTYSLLSERNHQLSTRLKEAHMWDHNGTYMEAYNLRYRQHSVEVALADGDDLAVLVDGQQVTMLPGEVETEHIFGLAEGELQLVWQLHKAQYGNAVEITSEMLQLLVWVTPAGTKDEGGVEQPAYLNFDLNLLGAPQDGVMQGVIGHTYMDLGKAMADADDWEFHHEAADFEMAGFSDAGHKGCLFQHAKAGARRLLGLTLPLRASVTGPVPRSSSGSAITFPLTAGGRGATRASLAAPQRVAKPILVRA